MKKAKQGKEISAILKDKTNQKITGTSQKPTLIPSIKPVSNLPQFHNYPFKHWNTTHKGYGCGGTLFVDKVYPHVYSRHSQFSSASSEINLRVSEAWNDPSSDIRTRSAIRSSSCNRVRNRNDRCQTNNERGTIHNRLSWEIMVWLIVLLFIILVLTRWIDWKMDLTPRLERNKQEKII